MMQPEVKHMIGFFIGCMVGGTVGVVSMCLCSAAAAADRHPDETTGNRNHGTPV